MDFSPDEGQQAVADVVTSALGRDNSWHALVDGGVIAFGVPERLGGDGLGLPEITTALTEIGRHGTVSPALATLGSRPGAAARPGLRRAAGPLPGRRGQGRRAVGGAQRAGHLAAGPPETTLSGGKLSGTKVGVPYAEHADWLVVTTDGGVVVVSPKADGVTLTKTPTSNHSDEYVVTFDGVAVADSDVLAGRTVRRVNQLVLATTGAFAAGLVAGALRLTADYVATREQFGKPLSTFQTVAAQLAEVYIASRTISLASTSVIWRLVRGPRRRRGPRRARVLADVAGAAGDAALPSPARRHGHGHHLPDGPLLLDDQGPDPAARRASAPLTSRRSTLVGA